MTKTFKNLVKELGGAYSYAYMDQHPVADLNAAKKKKKTEKVGEKYDSNKFFGGKGTPKQRTQLLKLQNKALRAFPSSPEQKAVRKEIDALRKKMGMKVKEGFASDAQRKAAFASGYKAKGKKKK